MLRVQNSLLFENAAKSKRVIDWVTTASKCFQTRSDDSSVVGCNSLKRKIRSSPMMPRSSVKRKLITDENSPTYREQNRTHKRAKSSSMSPKGFYNDEKSLYSSPERKNKMSSINHHLGTPESASTVTSSSLLMSPDKLDGILISRRRKDNQSSAILSDSESLQSTPVKQIDPATPRKVLHKLSCGLDSAECITPKVEPRRFFKLGQRSHIKTPLQMLRESIASESKKIDVMFSNSSPRNQVRKEKPLKSKKSENKISSSTTSSVPDVKADSPSQTTSSSPAVEVESPPPHSPSAPDRKTENLISNSTLQMSQPENDPLPSNDCVEKLNGDVLSTSSIKVFPKNDVKTKRVDDLDQSGSTLAVESCSPRLVQRKLVPLFQRGHKTPCTKDQMVIDAGQKSMDGAMQCSLCHMIYSKGDPNDEALHKSFHTHLIQGLKFTGWKKENIAERGEFHRIIYIDHNDPPYCLKKVQALKAILDQELGFVQESDMLNANRRLYLYVGEEKVKGMCLVEMVKKANRLEGESVSEISVHASVGINRIWVYSQYRRQGVATKLLDVIRSTYNVGMCLPRNQLAFSDPTIHGRSFAAKYTGTNNFLVYKP